MFRNLEVAYVLLFAIFFYHTVKCCLSFVGVDMLTKLCTLKLWHLYIRIIFTFCVLSFIYLHWNFCKPNKWYQVFISPTNSTMSFQDVAKRPFKGFVFYHKIEKKDKKHYRILTHSNHLAIYLSYIEDK